MDEIAESLGVTKPALYQYFPSKVDLLLPLPNGQEKISKGSLIALIRTGKYPGRQSRPIR